MKLKIPAVTTSQPPHSRSAARVFEVLASRLVNHRPAASRIRAAGRNQDTSPPKLVPNIRVIPAAPPKPTLPLPPGPPMPPMVPPPGMPPPDPVMRPRPL